MGARQLTGAALTAKKIKERLTALYPRVRFSVTSDTFSMGNSVDIRWTDGPSSDAVNAITKQYQYGSFDGMTDSYNYSGTDPALGCDGAKYVQCHRRTSPEYHAQIVGKAEEHYGRLDPSDIGYRSKLAEIEKMFFDYPQAEPTQGVVIGQGGRMLSGLEYEVIKDVDTRDNSELYVVKIITRVGDFKALRREMDSFGGYYSRFKHGFIFREDPTAALKGGSDDAESDQREEKSA